LIQAICIEEKPNWFEIQFSKLRALTIHSKTRCILFVVRVKMSLQIGGVRLVFLAPSKDLSRGWGQKRVRKRVRRMFQLM